MSLPPLPPFYNMQWSDKNGNLSTEAMLYNDEQSQTLVRAITLLNETINSRVVTDGSAPSGTIVNDGVIIPSKTTAQITALQPDAALGTMWFDTDIAKLKVKTAAGVVETITSA